MFRSGNSSVLVQFSTLEERDRNILRKGLKALEGYTYKLIRSASLDT